MPRTLTIPLGITNCHLIEGADGRVLVDAGRSGGERKFFKALGRAGVGPGDIKLIVVTHAHFDHVGSLAAIKRGCGGPPVMVSAAEAPILAAGEIVFSPGLTPVGRVLARFTPLIPRRITRFEPVSPEITVRGEMSLAPWGLAGKVIPTPGHTAGSISLVLDDGTAYVGSAALNLLPFGLGPIHPFLGNDRAALLASWERILAAGAQTIYPAHGKPFPAARLAAQLLRRKTKPQPLPELEKS